MQESTHLQQQIIELQQQIAEQAVMMAMKDTTVELLITTSREYMPLGDELSVDLSSGKYIVHHQIDTGLIVFEIIHSPTELH